jgi:cysteine desulfurase/selenocysteine lyase
MTSLDIAAVRSEFPILARRLDGKPLVYLDNAATSQKPRAMIERMTQIFSSEYARVQEGHSLSREATAALKVRAQSLRG